MTTPPPDLCGLVLAGGRSERMGRDKALLDYGRGRPQAAAAFDLLKGICARAYISARAEREALAGLPHLIDRYEAIGPVAGILTAMDAHPEAAWLVVACDLPFVTRETLGRLVAARDPARIATAFRSACDGLPEPLCAIYEPAARERLKAFVARGVLCPRKALIESSVLLLDPADGRALENVNRPDEYRSASGPAGAEVRIRYFAMLREQAGRTEETVRTEAATPRALWEELSARHGFRAPLSVLRVAVNEEFVSAEHALREGDTVAFIPPVAGG